MTGSAIRVAAHSLRAHAAGPCSCQAVTKIRPDIGPATPSCLHEVRRLTSFLATSLKPGSFHHRTLQRELGQVVAATVGLEGT